MKSFPDLQKEWYKKLEDEGFKDIEAGFGDKFKVRLRYQKSKGSFIRNWIQTTDFFRVIGIYIHNAEGIKMHHLEILENYIECGSIPEAIERTNWAIKPISMWKYLERNFPKMLKFVNELDRNVK